MNEGVEDIYGDPSLPIKKKMKIKKLKKYYAEKKLTKLSWPISAKSDKKIFYSKRKKKHKVTMAHECQI